MGAGLWLHLHLLPHPNNSHFSWHFHHPHQSTSAGMLSQGVSDTQSLSPFLLGTVWYWHHRQPSHEKHSSLLCNTNPWHRATKKSGSVLTIAFLGLCLHSPSFRVFLATATALWVIGLQGPWHSPAPISLETSSPWLEHLRTGPYCPQHTHSLPQKWPVRSYK